ncbi:MAG: hypothetical protein M1834_005116 [Cirrosporium novae-zelandiae]|nr:MAG: hypothetical protein M1834_005116 [Cirrosporium novae-zelandiae]
MSTLNLSTNGPLISKSYQAVVNSPPPAGPAAQSPTYGNWAVFSVSAPLVTAFQQDAGNKESVLKVQSTGEGELVDLIDEFSDGRIQFGYVKVKDPNTGLPKNVLIGWCGEGVPERTKGYFTSHLAAVSKTLHGYHVQITARSDSDLTPEGIVQKVADASGAKYSAGTAAPVSSRPGPTPPVTSKPVFTPTRSTGGVGGFKPLGGARNFAASNTKVDGDGWGEDAPPVTRTQLEKVQPAYKPTKVNMRELTSQKQEPARFSSRENENNGQNDVVKGGYQPIGKVDIGAIRRQAKESGAVHDDRPVIVKGAYEPVGKVDIAAIRARAQKPSEEPSPMLSTATGSSSRSTEEPSRSLAERSVAFNASERLTTLPKPKVAHKFGSGANAFTGTKAPTPGGFSAKPPPVAAPVGAASRTFADQGGKTPAQIWAEKKARERGMSGSAQSPTSSGAQASPIKAQPSGEWKSGYTGKSWAPVQITHTGKSGTSSVEQQRTGPQEEEREAPASPAGGISSIRDRFAGQPPMGATAPITHAAPSVPEPPALDTSSKPNAGRGIPMPGLPTRPAVPQEEEEPPRIPTPPQVPRSPTPPTPEIQPSSPIRIAHPVSASAPVEDAHEEQYSPPPPIPTQSIARAIPHETVSDESEAGPDPGRAAAIGAAALGGVAVGAAAAVALHDEPEETIESQVPAGNKNALVQYDYEKAEDNEIELKEGEYVTNIDMVDEDWWMGTNAQGETGLFPSNYVELVADEEEQPPAPAAESAPPAGPPAPEGTEAQGPTATSLYDYDAAEENELSFPEGAKILNVEFPDEDWWFGEYEGKTGLFPANYVQLDE